jgi:hypothetical protein
LSSYLKRVPILGRFFEAKGLVVDKVSSIFDTSTAKPDRNLKTYREKYDNDPTVGISIDTLSEMTCGVGSYNTIEDKKSEKALNICNDLAEKIRLDENLLNIDKCLNIYGFCPSERVINRGPPKGITQLLVLEPETVTYQRGLHGQILSYTQTIGMKVIKFKPHEIIWWVNNQVGNSKGALYGISRVKRVIELLSLRETIIKNINGIMGNQARPPVFWKVHGSNDVANLKKILEACRKTGADPIVYPKDAIENQVIHIDVRSPYHEYVKYIDSLIFQGLHSPMLDYLRNATEASARTMLEVIQRHVYGRQRYYKRMVEHELYEPHLKANGWHGEIPSYNFGSPKTGLENVNIEELIKEGMRRKDITTSQFFDILKKIGIVVKDPDDDEKGGNDDDDDDNPKYEIKVIRPPT